MKRNMIWAVALAIAALGGAAPAGAQGWDFYNYQYNSTITDFNKVVDRINDLKTSMKTEHDFTRGCSMLSSLIYNLKEAQVLAEKLADYAYKMDEMDKHRSAVDLHNAYLEERHFWEGEQSRMCK